MHSPSIPGRLSAVLGCAALLLALGSLWPHAGLPPWPAASAALLALAFAWIPSNVLPRALGSIAGVLALGLSSVELGAFWVLTEVLPR